MKDGSVDVILCYEVIEHVFEPLVLLQEMRRIIRPNGLVFMTAPNRWTLYDHHYHLWGIGYLPRHIADKLIEKLGRSKGEDVSAGVQKLSQMHYFSWRSLLDLCRTAGFHISDVREDKLAEHAAKRIGRSLSTLLRSLRFLQLAYRIYRATIMDEWHVMLKPQVCRTMKVCFLGGARYSQPLDSTNAKKFLALAVLGEMFVIGFSQDMRPRQFREHARFYLLPKWPWPVLRYLTMFAIGPWLALWVILRHGVTVLVAQSPYEGLAGAWAKTIARWLGRRVALVVESHGDFEESLFLQRRVGLPGLYRALMRWAARFALNRADVLRAVSNSTRAQLERWAPGKPLAQFPTWTDMEVFWEKGQEPGDRQPDIVYAGVLIPLKGVHHLISAFARIAAEIPEAKLVIIGRAENPEYAELLKEQVHQKGLDSRVEFIGELPQGQLAERMRKGLVFVLPTLSEGLPRVVFEAMASGTPVIGSQVSGIPEIVEDGVNGFLVPPGDEEALAERLRWVLTHPEEVRAMGERARSFARSFFSTEAYVEGYHRLLAKAETARQGSGTIT